MNKERNKEEPQMYYMKVVFACKDGFYDDITFQSYDPEAFPQSTMHDAQAQVDHNNFHRTHPRKKCISLRKFFGPVTKATPAAPKSK